MTEIELAYLWILKDRQGRPRYAYFRRDGRHWRLPGSWPQEPPSEAFMHEYRRLLELTNAEVAAADAPADRRDFVRGTMGKLISDYLDTAEYKQKKPLTARRPSRSRLRLRPH